MTWVDIFLMGIMWILLFIGWAAVFILLLFFFWLVGVTLIWAVGVLYRVFWEKL